MSEEKIAIQQLGAQGDGVGYLQGERCFVPLALPNEIWRRTKDDAFACVSPLESRVSPPCQHFSVCGGCLAQHMPSNIYQTWKLGIVRKALRQHDIMIEPSDLHLVSHSERRRCVLSAYKERTDHVVFGYHRARSHDLVAIEECPVLKPQIVKALPGLKDLLNLILTPSQSARVTILHCQQGLDVDLSEIQVGNAPQLLADIAAAVKELGLVRLTNNGDTVVMQAKPHVRLGEVDVPVPRATMFLQAVVAAERAMCERVVTAIGKAHRVADLFCGAGTFSFALARHAQVLAVDSETDALGALAAGRAGVQGLKPIKTLRRDLFREPLSRKELEPFDAVVFDPPRAGAESQARMLAKSNVPVVVAVSCNPGTLARDLAILIDSAYKLEAVHPIDQFLYSTHVECVAILSCTNKKTRRR